MSRISWVWWKGHGHLLISILVLTETIINLNQESNVCLRRLSLLLWTQALLECFEDKQIMSVTC